MKKNKTFYKSESIFKEWLYENINRFNNKPIPDGKGRFYFDGITKAISLNIDFCQPEAMLSFDDIDTDKNYDHYSIQYIGDEKYNPAKGFYDGDRVDEIYTYYNTYKELVIAEVFEPIIEYCNDNFKEGKSLYLLDYDGVTEGFIASSDEVYRDTPYLKYKLFIQT